MLNDAVIFDLFMYYELVITYIYIIDDKAYNILKRIYIIYMIVNI